MIQKIEENYRLMVENYQEKHKSDHWVGRYKASKLGEKNLLIIKTLESRNYLATICLQGLMMSLDLSPQ